ncbi:phosphate:H+ symporter [Lichtheimia hyalospora FSU 10163]|nr:phosphate:H+ symporter [Lichtheimia hyalospora FSU 10163]
MQTNHPNTQPSPLEALDDTKTFNWRQARTLLISSTGFFTDAYDIFIINLVTPMLGYIYYKDNHDQMPSGIQGPFKGMVSFGQLVGQLTFGFLGDAFGRKAIYGLELLLIIIATINCATSASAVEGVGAVGFLGFWRFILGVGIGGDYPMSSTVASEWSSTNNRGTMIAFIFSMQGVGQIVAALVTMVLLAIFKGAVENNVDNLDYVWRLCIGLGCIPAVATIYGRWTMPESPRYAVNVQNDSEGAHAAILATESFRVKNQKSSTYEPEQQQQQEQQQQEQQQDDFVVHFRKWKNLKVLLGVSLCWFFMDIAFYGTNLNQALILSSMGFAPTDLGTWDTLFKQALGNLILAGLGSFPGYITSVLTIERLGRKPIQYMGFLMVGALYIVLGAGWEPIQDTSVALFIVIFAVSQFFFNFGPNVTTFVLPAEVFPTRHRAKAHGIASASGKLGAIIATFAFNALADVGGPPGKRHFLPYVLIIFGILMLISVFFTRWIPETKVKQRLCNRLVTLLILVDDRDVH